MGAFYDKLSKATNEDKQVNSIYVKELQSKFNGGGQHSNLQCSIDTENVVYENTDGIYSCYCINKDGIKVPFFLLLECKLDIDFNIKLDRDKVVLQVVHYLNNIHFNKAYNRNGFKELPKVILIGSKLNCFALPSSYLWDYYAVNAYKGAASTFHTTEEGRIVLERISKDTKLEHQTIIYGTDYKLCMASIVDNILKYAQDLDITEDLSEKTLSKAFDFFEKDVLTSKQSNYMSSRQKAELFMQFVLNPDLCEEKTSLLSINKPEVELILNGNIIQANRKQWDTFRILYRFREYSKLEQKKITAITDRLIEDSDRRRKGDFYTTTVWVDEAHNLLNKNLGEEWRKNYIVWDCAWGTGNLTRDYNDWEQLYCSTLHPEDLSIGEKYNRTATKFQYDFLNDDVYEFETIKAALRQPFKFKAGINMVALEQYINFKNIHELYANALDKGIITQEEAVGAYASAVGLLRETKLYKEAPKLIEQLIDPDNEKPLLFLINPPYGTSKNGGTDSNSKTGIATTYVGDIMNENKLGLASRNLYCQFVYRIITVNQLMGCRMIVGSFTPADFMNTQSYGRYREELYNKFGFIDGYGIQASNFADVADCWMITFTLWDTDNKNTNTTVKLLEYADGNTKLMYNKDIKAAKKLFNKEIRASLHGEVTRDSVFMMSALNIKDINPKNTYKSSIGGFMCNANTIMYNNQFVALFSAPFYGAANMDITEEIFLDVVSLFSARRLITSVHANWTNWYDEYMTPDKTNSEYLQWESDCIVYSLFNSKSQQSSLRNIDYNGKIWNLYNEFFFMSKREMELLAGGEYSTDDINNTIEEDIEMHGLKERFVYEKLKSVRLSTDAQEVLDKAKQLVKSSFKYRKQFSIEHPEYNINTWDAGWYQIKGLLKQYEKSELEEFTRLYKALEDRMRPLVYELGFLYK